ncbi:MAG: hypothetical protein AAGM22_23610 [Acidobacteriota bacterium]
MPGRKQHVFTARFDEALFEEVQEVTRLQSGSINQFVTTAVQRHLRSTRNELMNRYEVALEKLRKMAAEDPEFTNSLDAFVDAELEHEDPIEGLPQVGERSPEEQELLDIFAASA